VQQASDAASNFYRVAYFAIDWPSFRDGWEQCRERSDAERTQLKQWVSDLQSGRYVNCVYCGWNFGLSETTPTSMADILREHIEQCEAHPMSALKAQNERLRSALEERLTKAAKNEGTLLESLQAALVEIERLRAGVIGDRDSAATRRGHRSILASVPQLRTGYRQGDRGATSGAACIRAGRGTHQ